MTDISNKLHIPQNSKGNLENDFNKSDEMFEAFQHLPSNPEAIEKQAKEIQKQKEAKEIKEKSLEFEDHTFRISSEGFKEVTAESAKNNPNLQKFLDKEIKVKANTAWDVVEYLEDTMDEDGKITCRKWEQLFVGYDQFIKYVAADKHCTKEEVEKKYLMTRDELEEKMKDKPDESEKYEEFLNKEIKGHLAGYWDPDDKFFSNWIGWRSYIWLVGGHNIFFYQYGWYWGNNDSSFGCSGRLLKN